MKEENSSGRVFDGKYKKLMDQLGRVFESANSNSESSSVEAEKGQFMKLFCEAFDSNTDHTGDEDDGVQFVDETSNRNRNDGWDDKEVNIAKYPQNSQGSVEGVKNEGAKTKEAEAKDDKEKEEKSDDRDVTAQNNVMANDTLLNSNMNAATSHVVRRVLRNLMLMMLSHHPNGVYDNELEVEYKRITKDDLPMDDNIEYLLFNHRNVLITPCVNRGNLLTLHHQPKIMDQNSAFFLLLFVTVGTYQAVQSILEEYSIPEITEAICGHINAIIRLFPCGISSDILNDVISNFCGYKCVLKMTGLSFSFFFFLKKKRTHVVVGLKWKWIKGCHKFYRIRTIYQPAESAQLNPNGHNCHGVCIVFFFFSFFWDGIKKHFFLLKKKVLSSAIGYRELFIALLIHHQKPISTEELEREFRQLFRMPLNASSPVINRILKKINDPKLNQEQKQLQLQHASHVRNEANFSRNVLRSGLRSSCNSLKFMISQFRLAPNFEAHYEKNRPLFELICAKCREDVSASIKTLCEVNWKREEEKGSIKDVSFFVYLYSPP
ncbi:hypothetical protein RFI_03424 [Reticulomyxa filosa]|uniref:Uncharacterized protein n=1 Tax=Reticulomyxa filosa TaxID=46433 RepID=X6P6D1_RETFI|nr:hypothetical protein RFI_03424 [Reticulomyxa filosa]|eukprot:ETO33673.1 hypothetical protein RFI_03424 [Reticulomyxa filosa]